MNAAIQMSLLLNIVSGSDGSGTNSMSPALEEKTTKLLAGMMSNSANMDTERVRRVLAASSYQWVAVN